MCEYCGELTTSSASTSSQTNTAPPLNLNLDALRLEYEIVSELAEDVFTDVPGFLEAIFPVNCGLLSKVMQNASKKRTGLYDNTQKRWANYPYHPAKHESHLYKPFVELVRSISRCIPARERNEVTWHDRHDHAPLSLDPCAPKIRPDIVATLGEGTQLGSDVADRIPWSRILVPIEIKKRNHDSTDESDGPALLQLLKYMRMIFHEAVDRSFVLGIVLAHTKMSVYIADRTGVLGSEIFDIHENADALVRVVVGICTMSPAKLGWDTSMAVLKEKERYSSTYLRGWKPKLSYQVPFNTKQEDHYWVIDMPKPKGDGEYGVMEEDATERFVLFKPLNLQRGQVIRGRATRIWKAWRFADLLLPPDDRKVFIVKDSWRDSDRRLEGEFYKQIGREPGVAVMHSYGIVCVDGEKDTVASRIRRNLSVHAKPRCINAAQRKLRAESIPPSTPDKTWGSTTDYTIYIDILPALNVKERTPRGKTHSRLVLETYGWPLKMALSPLEIVQAMKDVVIGHRAAYRRGVLHRDLSEGNVLITGSTEVGMRAVIIDFDYAKILGDPTLVDDPMSGTRPFMSGEILGQSRYFDTYGGAQYDDDDDDDDADTKTIRVITPSHSFWHDLESLFWILFWICMCRAGPALQRAELWKDDGGETKNGPREEYRKLFGNASNSQLASNKASIMKSEDQFEDAVMKVHRWCWQLRDLLRQFSVILRRGYRSQDFSVDDTYQAFMVALEATEQRLIAKPKKLLPEQQAAYDAEKARRAMDKKDWRLPPRALPDSAALLSCIDEEPTRSEDASGPLQDDEQREESPTFDPPVEKLAALVLVPRSESHSPTDSATGTSPSMETQHAKDSRTPKHLQSLDAQPATKRPSPPKAGANKVPPARTPTTKGVSGKAQATTEAPAKKSSGILTRAMKRAAAAAPSSSTKQTRSSETAAKKPGGPSHGTARAPEGDGDARVDTTTGRNRKKGKEKVVAE